MDDDDEDILIMQIDEPTLEEEGEKKRNETKGESKMHQLWGEGTCSWTVQTRNKKKSKNPWCGGKLGKKMHFKTWSKGWRIEVNVIRSHSIKEM